MPDMFPIKIKAKLQWVVTRTPSGALVGVCAPLGLASQGKDQLDLWLNIQESLQLVLNDLLRNGELDEFLRVRGWRVMTSLPSKASVGPVPFDVPFELISQAQHDSARAAH